MAKRSRINTGYTTREDGTAISVRGANAEENGKFTEGRFRSYYKVAKNDFPVLVALGLIRSSEWHHTGARFNRSDFYEWSDAKEVDYGQITVDGRFYEGSLAEKYLSEKKTVSALVKEAGGKAWEYVTENYGHYNIPSIEDFVKAAAEDPRGYSQNNSLNYNLIRITGKEIEDYLTPEQKEERTKEHSDISLQGETLGSAYFRRELHQDVDKKYNQMAIDNIPAQAIREAYDNAFADDIKHNSEVEGKIQEAHAKNMASDGKEKVLIRIAELMGVKHSDAERRAYNASMSNLAAAGYSWNVQKRQEYASQIDAVLADIEKKQKDYVTKLIKQGRAERRERIASLPQMFATEKEEMNGRYGWFDANSNYNLPRYYTGVEFKDRRGFNHYNDIKKNSLNIIEVLHDKRDYEIASGPSEEDIKRLRMQKSDATVSDVVSTKDAMLRDELIRRMRESGINVVTNERQAQRALERANNRVKFSGDAPKGVAANPVIYTSYNVDDVDALKEKYPSGLSDKYYHHSTVKYGYQPLDTREGKKEHLHIIGRLTTDKVDVLVVENPESDNRTPHITLATAKGIKPVASNFELEKYKDKIQPLDDYVDVTFTNNLRNGATLDNSPVTPAFKEWFGDWENNPEQASKVVDKEGKPLIVEHGTNNDFTEFDINRLGETSHDKGIYGAGFYFATEAPAWLNARNKMKVYLDIKKPFEITASMENDIYTSFSEKLDTPAFRALKLHTFNDKEISVGEYIDVIKAVDDFIEHNPDQVNEQIAQDEELQSYHPKDCLQMWREGEISKRSGAAVLAHSWNVIISSMIGSEEFTEAAKKSGYDGIIVNRDEDYREYIAFEPNQIKSATENIGTYRRDSNDIRFHKAYHGSGNDFDDFDHSHMGEGVGNQSYGWGTYVTEVEGIGRMYANTASLRGNKPFNSQYKGERIPRGIDGRRGNYPRMAQAVAVVIEEGRADNFKEAVNLLLRVQETALTQSQIQSSAIATQEYKDNIEALKNLREEDFYLEKSPRYLYTVEIPNEQEADYLDYTERMGNFQNILDNIDNTLSARGWKRQEIDDRIVFTNNGHIFEGGKQIILNPRQTGADLYQELSDAFGSDKEASLFLHNECNIAGIKYPAEYMSGGRTNGEKNYVIFSENDIRIKDKLSFFKTQAGTAYGFALDGKIFVDTKIATAETPIHEYTHLWAEVLREQNPREWKNIVSLMKGAPEIWNKVVKQYPELHSDDEIADEVLAQYSGKRGYEKLMQMHSDGEVSKGALDTLMQALEKLWKKVAEFFRIHYTSKEEVADRVLRDLLSGVNPRQEVEKYLKRQDKQYMKAVERGDEKKVQEIFQKSLRFAIGNGMTPYIAVDGYRGKLRGLAHKVKTMDKTAINTAADKMAPLIPRNAVLVPAPSHKGEATDMLKLAKAISRRRHVEVMDVLKSYERERQYTSKKFGGKAISSDNMGIVAIKDIPEGKIPVVIDNVVSTGNTAEACVKALGYGIVVSLADATTAYKHTASLKNAAPIMRNQAGEVIPLSKRFDLSGAKYIGHAAALQKVGQESLIDSLTEELKKYNGELLGVQTKDDLIGVHVLFKHHLDADAFAKDNKMWRDTKNVGTHYEFILLNEAGIKELTKRGYKLPKNIEKVSSDLTQGKEQASPVQGLEGYSHKDIEDIVESYVQDILDESDIDATIEEVTVIGSRSRNEAKADSDLDILLEYSGEDYPEDAMYNLLHDDENPLEIEGLKVDINPINPHYSLSTEEWLARDARWREEDKKKVTNNKNTQNMKDSFDTAKLQEEAVRMFGKNFMFDLTNFKKQDPHRAGHLSVMEKLEGKYIDTFADKVEIKDGILALYSTERSRYINLEALDTSELYRISNTLDEIKAFNSKLSQEFDKILDDNKDVLERLKNNPVNHSKDAKPYIIHIGTDDRGIVEGEFHVQFTDDNIKLNFDDMERVAKENGGTMRLMNGKPWFDFYDKGSAEKFAEQITSIGKNITNTINSKEMANKTTTNEKQGKEKLPESEVLKGKATVSPDGEVVSLTNDKGEKEDFRHVHGGTHDDPALLYSNTRVDVYFYDTEKKTIENIDNEAGIDNYADRKGMFLVRADEYNEAYYQLEAHDRSYDEGEAAARVYSRYKDCEKENGEKPLYAEVTVLFNGETEKEEMIIKLSNDIDERDDEKVFFNVDGLDGLRKLMSPNNGEDFKIVDQDGIDFLPASTFLGENKQQEKEKSKTLAPVIPTNGLVEQFNKLKAQHPDAMLLFRTGDFYETYEEDAKEAAKVLGITLTKSIKQKNAEGKPLSMAGFPYHALDTYLPKLIRSGHRVAICDQLELPKKTLAHRGITELVSPGLAHDKDVPQAQTPEQEENKNDGLQSTSLFKDKQKNWNLVIITAADEGYLRQVVVPSSEDISEFFGSAKGKSKDEVETLRNALGEKYLARIADGSCKVIESSKVAEKDSISSYVKMYADLMIAKIKDMKEAKERGDGTEWKKPWIGISGTPRSIYGNSYLGMNNFILSLLSEKWNYKVPVFATLRRFDELNYTVDKNGKRQPVTDEKGNKLPLVHVLKGQHSFPVQFNNITFVNKDTGDKTSYKNYKAMTPEEREAYDVKRIKGWHQVFCVEQTNLKEARPELYKKLAEPYTVKDVAKQGKIIDFTPADVMVANDLWICPIKIKEGSDRAFFRPSDNTITLPAKQQFFKDVDYYSTMFHEIAHSTGIEPLHNRDFSGFFGSKQYAREELVAELTAAVVASQQGLTKEIKEESAQYLSSWSEAITDDPNYLTSVLHDVDKASATINNRIADIQEQLENGIGADYSEIRKMNDELRNRYSPSSAIETPTVEPEPEPKVEEEEVQTQEEKQTEEMDEERGKGMRH